MGVSLDTGALIGLVEQRRLAMRKVYDVAISSGVPLRVSTAVVAEWWRGGAAQKRRAEWLRSLHVEVVSEPIARLAGIAIGQVRGAGTIDAIVLATAALSGDLAIYAADPKDLAALRDGVAQFAHIRIIRA